MDTKKEIEKILAEIRPHLQFDGGDVEFVSFDEKSGELKVKLKGACHGCPMAQITLRDGIGREIKKKIPAVKEVIAV